MTSELFMKRALELAASARGKTSPNPMVGAVLVMGEEVIAEGTHREAGGPHAEIEALTQAGGKAKGATLVVTLEPCAHFGKTPPCVDAIIKAGVKKVVAAMLDPNPEVNGTGVAALRAAGIEVEVGLLGDRARRLNEVFVKWIRTKLPFVTMKWGMTLDGKIAVAKGEHEWITGEKSRRRVHEMRSESDAVLVGVNTVLKDDPLLTARIPKGKNPIRIILDSSMQTPQTSRMLRTISDAPTWIVGSRENPEREGWFKEEGAEVLRFPGKDGRVDLQALCRHLGEQGLSSLLVEGGARVHGAFLNEGLADKLIFFISPKLVGDVDAVGPIEGWARKSIRDALSLTNVAVSRLEDDIVVEGYT